MIESIANIKKNEEEALSINASVVVPGYFSAEEIEALSPYQMGNVSVSLSGSRNASLNNVPSAITKSDSGYIPNTKEMSKSFSQSVSLQSLLGANYTKLQDLLTSAQGEKLASYVSNNDWLNAATYLLELKNSYTAELDRLKGNRSYLTGLYYYKNEQAIKNIENNILPEINNCLTVIRNYIESGTPVVVGEPVAADPLLVTRYGEVESVVEGKPVFSAPKVPAATADISTIINYQIAEIIYQLQNADDFHETFYADRLDKTYGEYFNNEETEKLELLVNGGDSKKTTEYLESFLSSSQELLKHLQEVVSENPQHVSGVLLYKIEQLKEKIKLIKDMLNIGQVALTDKYFNKVKTDFIKPKTGMIEALKERLLFYGNLQKLMSLVSQAAYDGYNVVKQAMENQSGYQGMNLNKINAKQLESLINYSNTRKTEIYEYINNYNEKVKAEVEAKLEKEKESGLLGFISRAGLGVISALAGLVSMIFSAGITAPLVMSSITTTYEVFNTNKEAKSDNTVKEELEELEEELALLRATEQREEREILEKKTEELLERRKLSKADFLVQTGLTETEWQLFVDDGFFDDEGRILDNFFDNPEAFYDLAASTGANLDGVRRQFSGKYHSILNLEIYIQQCLAAISNIDQTSNGFYNFDNQRYLTNSRHITGLTGILNAYQSIFSAQFKSRNIVAEELGLGKTYEGENSASVFQQVTKDTLNKIQRVSDLQHKQVQASNAAKTLREEVKRTTLSSFFKNIGSVGLQLVNIMTYNAAAPFVKNLMGGLGKGFFDFYSGSYTNNKYDYNRYGLNELNGNGLISAEYAALFDQAGYNDLIYKTAGSRTAVNYDQYLELLKKIEFINIINGIKLSMHGLKASSRNMIHDILTDKKGYAPSTGAAAANYENEHNLMQDVLKKQVGLAAEVSEANNRKAMAELEVHKSGLSILTSSLSGLLGGYFSTAKDESSQVFAKILGYFVQNSGADLLEMSLSNSDFNLAADNNGYGSAKHYKVTQNTDEAVLEMLNDSYSVKDSSGQLYIDVERLAKKIMEINRLASLNQVIAATQETRRKAREMIVSILTEKAGAMPESISKKQAQLVNSSLQGQIDAIYQNMLEVNKILSQRNVRLTQAQRNLYTGILQSGVTGLGGVSLTPEQITTVADASGLALRTSFSLIDINDQVAANAATLEIAEAEELSLSETLVLNKVEEHEEDLLIESLKVKQNIGKYGMTSADLSTLEYLSIILKKIQTFKEKVINLYTEIAQSRGEVSAAMTSIPLEMELIAKQVSENASQLNKTLLGFVKKATEDKANSMNIQQRKELNAVMGIFDGAVNSVQGAGAFTEGASKETYGNYAFYLSGLNDSLKGLVSLKYENTSKSGCAAVVSTKGLTAAEVLAVETAGLQEELSLMRSAEELIKYTNNLVNSGISNTASLAEAETNEDEFYRQIEQLLVDQELQELRAEVAGYEYTVVQQRAQAAEYFNYFSGQDSEWYELYFKEAHRYFLKGQYQKASDVLQKKFTPEFLTSVNTEKIAIDKVQDLMTHLKELNAIQQKLATREVDLYQAENRLQSDWLKVEKALKDIYERYNILNKKNEVFQKALISLEDPVFQQGLNSELNAAFADGEHSFTENLSRYLLLSPKEAKGIELSISSSYYSQALQETRDYVTYYRALMKDVVLIARLQDDFVKFEKIIMDYNNNSYAFKGRPSKEYFSVLLANNMYVNYLNREESARNIIGSFNEITQELGKINKAKRQELELDKREVVMAVLKASYEGVENYQTLTEADRAHQLRVYNSRWRDMYNLYVEQSRLNLRKRDLAQDWQSYFQENNYKEEEKQELHLLKQDLKQAESDQKELALLFSKYGESEKVDINTANISRELKGYILHITGNNPTYQLKTRTLISKYVQRKINSLETKIANKETDINFAVEVYEDSQQEMIKLEEEYNELWLDYQNSYRDMADEKVLKDKLNNLKDKEIELESSRRKYQKRYEQYQKKLQAGVLK